MKANLPPEYTHASYDIVEGVQHFRLPDGEVVTLPVGMVPCVHLPGYHYAVARVAAVRAAQRRRH